MEKMTFSCDLTIKSAFNEIAEFLEHWDSIGVVDVRVEPIEHEAREGFMPFTNGGWSGRAAVLFRDGKDHFKAMSSYAEQDHKDMLCEFREDLTRKGAVDAFDDASDEDIWNRFSNEAEKWQDGWEESDDDVFFLDFRAVYYAPGNFRNKSGKPEVYFYAGVNTDFNYGRDSITWAGGNCCVHEYEVEARVSDLSTDRIEQIKQQIINHFEDA
ncbi:MAG: hypothetical protein KGL39_03165 [Patescibacteria group bacterium]|nr:hypothetical protein [Patescibacteria group bacterium]